LNKPITETNISGFPLRRGKVRDLYDLGDRLLVVATDRISVFDQVFPDPIPDKGKILTGIAAFWFKFTGKYFPNHLISTNVQEFPSEFQQYESVLNGRSMLVKKGIVIPIKSVVRGYLTGSAWQEYLKRGEICGVKLPSGMVEGGKLPEPIFTPTTKAEVGHDELITIQEMSNLVGSELTKKIKEFSESLYFTGAKKAEEAGIIIADTKFEFAWINNELTVMDEIFTPDSSRFWLMNQYQLGKAQPSFDQQFIRDYLSSLDWDHNSTAPRLPEGIITKTRAKYLEAYTRLTGENLLK
jgi:phosphoribosylaminoimidazole-succinocarboxamide synthase